MADLNAVDFSDANHGWAVGSGGAVVATTDGGEKWRPQASQATLDLNAVDFADARHGWGCRKGWHDRDDQRWRRDLAQTALTDQR